MLLKDSAECLSTCSGGGIGTGKKFHGICEKVGHTLLCEFICSYFCRRKQPTIQESPPLLTILSESPSLASSSPANGAASEHPSRMTKVDPTVEQMDGLTITEAVRVGHRSRGSSHGAAADTSETDSESSGDEEDEEETDTCFPFESDL